jgi:endonuclease/exonuclease/phosphatase family metal-dependent hydrolase
MYVFLRLGGRWIFVRAAGLGLGIWLLGGLVADAATVSDITDRAIVAGGTTGPISFTLSNFDPKQTIRTVAANITSGNGQAYEAEGTRILQGLQPDVVMIQEFDVSSSSSTDLRNWVNSTFGSEFSYFRENYNGIPNGVISRWPIVASGSWDDTTISDRGFAWARIDIPGDKNLWVVSVHLKASSGSSNSNQRQSQAQQLVTYIQANVPAEDYLLLGGDFNTYSTSESCLSTLGTLLTTAAPYPVDQSGDADTNASRAEQYDWVLAESELDGLETPVKIGTLSFANGLVFDSRRFTPLSSVEPVLVGDSGATNMQHMAVVRAFAVPALELLTVTASSSNPTLVPNANIVVSGSGVSRTVTVTPAANQTGTATITVAGGDGVSTASDTFVVTVNPVTPAESTYAGWSGGAVLDSVGLSKYAIGGASSLTATDGVKPSSALSDGFLVITAIVRTDNSSLTVVGQAVSDLANYVSGTGVTTVNGVETTDQAGVPTGHKRKTFSVAQGSDVKNFIRLSASLSLSGINTTVSVARDSGGATFLQVTGATAGATSGGTATSEKRTVYYFASDTTSSPTYTGSAWPYVLVQGQLSAGAEVTATLTKNSSGVLLVNGRPAYQYIGNSSSSTANAVSGTWPAMRVDGTKTTIGPSGSLQ